ncbi:MAG: glutathione S-transferase N-terminal domain-containing protein [Solirubrobacterales bacterium]
MSDPVLWHIPISHYSEKVRWALDHKGVPHRRRPVPPPAHMAVAYAITRGGGYTLPLLQVDGRALADSTEIIAVLEERHPDRPLYPADAEVRSRALELEDYFDEHVGPATRLLGFHSMRSDPEAMGQVAAQMLPESARSSRPVTLAAGQMGKAFAAVRYGSDSEDAADAAREALIEALNRLEAELDGGDGDYLVGDEFTVADLTAAALLAPAVRPAEGPKLPDPPPAYDRFLAPLRERRAFEWVKEIFSRHRHPAG